MSKTVLVVEDEFLIRLVAADALREHGYEVLEAVNADEAIDIFRSGLQIDLVFSDVRMPGSTDGLGLLAFVRSVYSEVPVIITSGHLPNIPGTESDSTQFMAKPYKMEQVIRLIRSALAEPR